MRWIPIQGVEHCDQRIIRLPCPASDLVRLAAVSQDAKAINRLLRRSPPLMLLAFSRYHDRFDHCPDSPREFAQWCRSELIGQILTEDWRVLDGRDRRKKRFPKLKPFLDDYLGSRTNRELRRSLSRFLIEFAGVEKRDAKRWVKLVVGKRIRADQFRSQGLRSKQSLTGIASRWKSKVSDDVDVHQLLRLVSTRLKIDAEFERELLRQKLAAMKQLAYGASHEINNPLANISTRAQTMLSVESDPEKRHKLSVIYEQAMRAHEMISDMMLFAHPPAIQRQQVSVRLLVSKVIHEMDGLLAATPAIELAVTVGAGVDQALLDPTQISVLIKNLMQNSVEAIRSADQCSGRIEIRVSRTTENEIVFSIWDNGIGISKSTEQHLFDPFYSGREAGRGLGFGLSKVWTIAQLHGGSVHYDPTMNSGTRFLVRLPVQSNDLLSAELPELAVREQRSARDDEAA